MAKYICGHQALTTDHASLIGKQGTLFTLLVRQGLNKFLQVIYTKRDMPRLVAGHQVHHILEHRVRRCLAGGIERGQSQALDHNLHTNKLHIPTLIGQDLVDNTLQVRIDRIHHANTLLQVFVEHLNVARFIESLGSRIELGVQRGCAGAQLGRHQ